MANTTNYNWETPDDTDLVKDGAAAIRTLGSSVDTTTKALNPSTTLGDIEYRSATANTNTRLAIGTTGQVLSVVAGVPAWATSDDANAIQNAIVDAKGDIVAASAADTPARLAVGTDNQRLIAASGEATGLKYVSDTQNTVIDAAGDLLYGTAADTLGKLAIGTTGQVLTVAGGVPSWATPAAGGGGKVLQVVYGSYATQVSSSSSTYADTGLTATITPTLDTSKILVIVSQQGVLKTAGNSVNRVRLQLLRGATSVLKMGDSTAFTNTTIDNQIGTVSSTYLDSPATTSATTYKTQIASGNNTAGVRAQHYYDDSAAAVSTITLLEIGA